MRVNWTQVGTATTELTTTSSRRVATGAGWVAIAVNVAATVGYLRVRDWNAAQWSIVAVLFCAVTLFGIAAAAERQRTAEAWARERLREEKADADMAEQRAGVMAAQRRFMEQLDPSKISLGIDGGIVVPGGSGGGVKH